MEKQKKHSLKLTETAGKVTLVILAVAVFWGLALGVESQGEQDISQWTAETHDNTNLQCDHSPGW